VARRRMTNNELLEGGWGATLQLGAAYEAGYVAVRKKMQSDLAQAEAQRLEELTVYQKTRKKREILQSGRHKQQAEFELELQRHERQRVDEAFLIARIGDSND